MSCSKKVKKKCTVKGTLQVECTDSCAPKCHKKKKKRPLRRIIVRRVIKKIVRPRIRIRPRRPVVNVTVNTPDMYSELRDQLRENIGNQIELIFPAGAGSGGEVPNRIGIVESVGTNMFSLRSFRGGTYEDTPLVYYTLSHIIGFVVGGYLPTAD